MEFNSKGFACEITGKTFHEGVSIGIDLGGTKIEAIALEVKGAVCKELIRKRIPTPKTPDAITEAMVGLVHDCGKAERVGVGMPGNFTKDDRIKNSNTVALNGTQSHRDFETRLGRQVRFENDANCFALAETLAGAAKQLDAQMVFGVIMGTGVGGGIVINGKIHPGLQGLGGEWGHHRAWLHGTALLKGQEPKPCYCGNSGCVEAHLSGPAGALRYKELTGVTLPFAEVVKRNDEASKQVIQEMCECFGMALANVVNILDPDAIVLGGGLSNLDCWYDAGYKVLQKHAFTSDLETPVLRHALGDSAGVIGAALLAASQPAA